METGLDLPVRTPATGDLRRVRLLGTRHPLQPLPKENQLMALTISDIARIAIAATALSSSFLFGIDVI